MTKEVDVVIIGAGPAGMTAAVYAARANLKTVLLDRGIYGGQMNNTADIDNYPGFVEVQGPELGEKMYQTVQNAGASYEYGDVQAVKLEGDYKRVITDSEEYLAPAVIIATGSEHKHLNVPGEETYSGHGVSYCAVCDAAFFRDEDVTVIGGGDSAIQEGLYLDGLDILDENGWIPTDELMRTRQEGIFAAGDVRPKDLRQVTTAVGEGSVAGQEAYNYLQAKGFLK